MAGLVPAIYVFKTATSKDVDARNKSGHDNNDYSASAGIQNTSPSESSVSSHSSGRLG